MNEAELRALAGLIRGRRTAALGTLQHGAPYVSLVLYVLRPDLGAFYFHLSRLALHTRNLAADGRASLMIAEPDVGAGDPQALRRVSLQGDALALPTDSAEHSPARAGYLAKFPEAGPTFDLGDFGLYCLEPREGRFIAAFGRILDLTPDHLRAASRL